MLEEHHEVLLIQMLGFKKNMCWKIILQLPLSKAILHMEFFFNAEQVLIHTNQCNSFLYTIETCKLFLNLPT